MIKRLLSTVVLGLFIFAGSAMANLVPVGDVFTDFTGTGFQVAIFNGTGPTNGCSTPSGFPICTQATFLNSVLTVVDQSNNTTVIPIGSIGPSGFVSQSFASVSSVSFQANISPLSLTNDLTNTFQVGPSIVFVNFPGDPLDGLIEVSTGAVVPEPSSLGWLTVGLAALVAARLRLSRRAKKQNQIA